MNFAVHCATTGPEISTEHLDAERPLLPGGVGLFCGRDYTKLDNPIPSTSLFQGFDVIF